jgi:hypothetical protein
MPQSLCVNICVYLPVFQAAMFSAKTVPGHVLMADFFVSS